MRSGATAIITTPDSAGPLSDCRHDDATSLNSRRVISRLLDALKDVPQYDHAEIKRNKEAATLKLKSYDWVFDIVPCFITTVDSSGQNYYLIPDGEGHWKLTDPRIDQSRMRDVSVAGEGAVLPVIRLMKYWNQRRTAPRMPAYLLETIAIYYYETQGRTGSRFCQIEVACLLEYLSKTIRYSVPDPKQIQGDLNTLDGAVRTSIAQRADADARNAYAALGEEERENQGQAIDLWQSVFGEEFL